MIGKIVNFRYEVLEKIGDGPLFSVFKSRDKVLNRLVALKLPTKELNQDPDFAQAVVDSYSEMGSLIHPNIARMLEAACVDSECFVASEFARGTSVKERVHRAGAIAAPLAVEIVIPVLSALDYAHSNGIIHADLAPQDIIVSPDGDVKVTDFGLSQALTSHPEIADKCMMRSVHYQAPELTEGGSPTTGADLYSVGVILYEMLTGQHPFGGATSAAVALKKIKDIPPTPRSVNTAVPKSLSDIVMKAIEPAPQDRYQSAAAMLADLKAISESLRTGVPISSGYSTASGAVVARTAEEVEEEAGANNFKSQYWRLLILFLVVCSVFTLVAFMFKTREAKVRVPPLLGKTWDEAQYDAQKAGIRLVDDGQVFSDTYDEGQICYMSPPANTEISKDSEVKVKISKGRSRVSVPFVQSKSEADANAAIAQAGFVVGKSERAYSDKVPANYVISQDPSGGTNSTPGSSVDLVISMGPKPEDSSTEPNNDTSTGPSGDVNSTDDSSERTFGVDVEVPDDAVGAQTVRIVVNDSQGESVAYDKAHQPGEKLSVDVTGKGSPVRIRAYVGGKLASDDSY